MTKTTKKSEESDDEAEAQVEKEKEVPESDEKTTDDEVHVLDESMANP